MLVTSAIAVGSPFGVFTYSDENHTVAVPVCPVFTHSLGLYPTLHRWNVRCAALGNPEQYLDFESVREIVPEQPRSWREEFRDQLFGPSSPAKPAAVNGSRS